MQNLLQFQNRLLSLKNRKTLKIILHVGSPKTATTTLQHLLHNNRDLLLENGFMYPLSNNTPPKHQWMVKPLRDENLNFFTNRFVELIEPLDSNIHTLILSTEGLFNHWFDFTPLSRAYLKMLAEIFDIRILCVLRDQVSFTKSYYQQMLKNPQLPIVKCYGQDLSIDELLEDSWFLQHLDYYAYTQEWEVLFTKEKITLLKYDKNILTRILEHLEISFDLQHTKSNKNVSLNTISCEMLRVINRYNLSPTDKQTLVTQMREIDIITSHYNNKDILSVSVVEKIKKICKLSNQDLEKHYNITFKDLH